MTGNKKGSSAKVFKGNPGAKAAAWGLSVLALVFGFALAGCDNGSSPDGSGDAPGWTTEYAVGDTGPGGGKIFYVSEAGFTVYTSTTDITGTLCHYLEAAPEDMSSLAWASSGYTSTDITGTETAIGTGRKNTALILATDAAAPAAKACKDLTTGGKTDWFLPSKDELDKLYENKASVGFSGISSNSYYWSSSQRTNTLAWALRFSDGAQDINRCSKNITWSYRAVRAF